MKTLSFFCGVRVRTSFYSRTINIVFGLSHRMIIAEAGEGGKKAGGRLFYRDSIL